MNQHTQSVKNIVKEVIITLNEISPKTNSRTPSIYLLVGVAIVLLAGIAVHSTMGEINFPVLMSPPVKQAIAEAPQQVPVAPPMYWQSVVSDPKDSRLCYDYPDENYFEC